MKSQTLTAATARQRVGFTIVELLVVITIIGILMALLFPAINLVRAAARKSTCASNQRQVGQAVLVYTTFNGKFPSNGGPAPGTTATENINWPWVARIFPQLERNDIYDDMVASKALSNEVIEILKCPSDPPALRTAPQLSFAGNGGKPDTAASGGFHDLLENGVIFRNREQTLQYISGNDGVSTTAMLTENVDLGNWNDAYASHADEHKHCVVWDTSPPGGIELNQKIGEGPGANYARPSSRHSGGFHVTFCDASTRFLSEEIDYNIYAMIMTPNGKLAGQTGRLNEADLNR